MAGYERQIATAQRLIAKRGQAVFWNVRDEGTTDPNVTEGASAWRPKPVDGVSPDPVEVRIAFFPITKDQYESLRARGIELSVGSVMGYMGAVSFTPAQKDSVTRDGKTLEVEYFDVLAPNGDVILYELYFKGSSYA